MNEIIQLAITDLTPHPLNKEIYDAFNPERHIYLTQSIKENGILEPIIITHDRRIISGHRRHNCARLAGLTQLPCVYASRDVDERIQLIESNRQRIKSMSERMREASVLAIVESERAKERMRFGATSDEKGQSRDIVAEAVGMKPITFMKANDVWEASKVNENAKEVMDKLDRGEISVDSAHRAVRTLLA
jgi:hypothetical protein